MPLDPTALLSANPAGAAIGAGLGAIQTTVSLINEAKAKKEAKELGRTRPKREIYGGYGKNLSLTESEMAGGMSQAAESAYNNQLDKSTAASLAAILKGGGSVNNVADVFAGGEEGRQRLALMNDQLRLSQIDNVVKARNQMGEEVDKNFLFNDWMPWKDKQVANSEARQSANEGIWSGLNTLTGGIMGAIGNGNGGGGGGNGSVLGGVTSQALDMAGSPVSLQSNYSGMNQRLSQPTPGFNPQSVPYPARIPGTPSYNHLFGG